MRQLRNDSVALAGRQALDRKYLGLIEVEQFPAGFGMHAQEKVTGWFDLTRLGIEQSDIQTRSTAVHELPDFSFEKLLQAVRNGLVGRVCAGEERVAPSARDGERVELSRLVRNLFIRTIGMKTLSPATVDVVVECAVRAKFVDAQNSDLRTLGVTCRLRGMRAYDAESSAVR